MPKEISLRETMKEGWKNYIGRRDKSTRRLNVPHYRSDIAEDQFVLKEAAPQSTALSETRSQITDVRNRDNKMRISIRPPQMGISVKGHHGVVFVEHWNSQRAMTKYDCFNIVDDAIAFKDDFDRVLWVPDAEDDTRNVVARLLSQKFGRPCWNSDDVSWLELESSIDMDVSSGSKRKVTEDEDMSEGRDGWSRLHPNDEDLRSTTMLDMAPLSPPDPNEADKLVQGLGEYNEQHRFRFSPMSGFLPMPSYSPMSNFSTPGSFMTAYSPASFMTARSTYHSPAVGITISTIVEEPTSPKLPDGLAKLSLEYQTELRDKELIQPFDKELNWSGKGQHVTFAPNEAVKLSVVSHLGASPSAIVERVLCRRVALARKTMRCTRNWTVADAFREVYHLQNLRHFHIVQLVGTYLQGRNFAILMYPAADCHLGTFLEDTADMQDILEQRAENWHRRLFLGSTFGCLASAISFVHDNTTKHMDIKPQNILVRRIRDHPPDGQLLLCWRIYLSDFGLSRSFASNDHSQTDGPTSRTPKYCAPEVYEYESRGRSSDVFSLGCVYAEIATTYASRHPHDFADFRRNDNGDDSFRLNSSRVTQWIDELDPDFLELRPIKALIHVMLRTEPRERPKAAIVARILHYIAPVHFNHCGLEPEPYTAYSESIFPFSTGYKVADPFASPVNCPGTRSEFMAESWVDEIMNNLKKRKRMLLNLDSIFFAADPDRGCYYQPKKTAPTWGYEPPAEDSHDDDVVMLEETSRPTAV
jgi:serine/threonine protein kinase